MLVDVQIMRNERMDFFEAVEKHLIRWDYEFVPAGCGPVEHLAEDDDVYMIIRQVYQTDQCEETPELICLSVKILQNILTMAEKRVIISPDTINVYLS